MFFSVFPSSGKLSNASSIASQPSPVKYTSDESHGMKYSSRLRDFLYKQIDYMMTVESREVPAEGRRGTHVEVCKTQCNPKYLGPCQISTMEVFVKVVNGF